MASEAAVDSHKVTEIGAPGPSVTNSVMLFVASFLALYFELVIIRYL